MDEEHYSESDYSFYIKPNFSTLGSIIEIRAQGQLIGFVFNDIIGNLFGIYENILYEEYFLSKNLSIFYHSIMFSYKQI